MTSSSPRLAAADRLLLRSVFAWARANGWRYQRSYMEPGRDHNGAPSDDGARLHRWSRSFDNGEQPELEACVDCETGLLVGVLFRPDDSYSSWVSWGGEAIRSYGLRIVIDGLASLGILPAHFSSAFTAGRESVWEQAETDYRVYHVHHEGGGKCFVDRYTDPGDAREAADFFANSDPRKSNHWVERTETVEREVPLNA